MSRKYQSKGGEKDEYNDEVPILDSIRNADIEESDEQTEHTILKEQEYIGTTNETKDKIGSTVNIGNTYGTIKDSTTFNKSIYTHSLSKFNKILIIDTPDRFDEFTNLYGFTKKKQLQIDWLTVSQKYKGIYILSSINNRALDAVYKEKPMTSWITEYKYLDDVIIFTKEIPQTFNKKINYPFDGFISEDYLYEDKDFGLLHNSKQNKILVINNVKEFDKFTNQYGYIKKSHIRIKWSDVQQDFKGIYIPQDIDLGNRQKVVFFNDKKYSSWFNLEIGLVYLFEL